MAKKKSVEDLNAKIAGLVDRQKRTDSELLNVRVQKAELVNDELETKFNNLISDLKGYLEEAKNNVGTVNHTNDAGTVDVLNALYYDQMGTSLESIIEQYAGKEGDK